MHRKLLLLSVLCAAGVVALVLGMPNTKPTYSLSLAQFLAAPRYDETVRLRGRVARDSLCRVEKPCSYRFRLTDAWPSELADKATPSRELPVHYEQCVVPDRLQEVEGSELQLVVEGQQCASCQAFEATSVMVKYAGKWELRERDHGPAQPVTACAARF